jgi:hypothetical protein
VERDGSDWRGGEPVGGGDEPPGNEFFDPFMLSFKPPRPVVMLVLVETTEIVRDCSLEAASALGSWREDRGGEGKLSGAGAAMLQVSAGTPASRMKYARRDACGETAASQTYNVCRTCAEEREGCGSVTTR